MQIVFKYLISLSFLLFNFNLIAQDFELFKIESTYYPKQAIEESSRNGEIGFWEWSGQFAIPKPLKNKKTILINKLGYSNLRVDMKAELTNTSVEVIKYYHTIFYNLGIIQTLNSKWRLNVNLIPTLASDFEESLNGDDFLFQANALAINTKSRKFQYGFGLAYTTRFGRQIVIPMGILKYNTPKMALDLVLPNRLSAMFKASETFRYGLVAALNGGLFNNNSVLDAFNVRVDETGYSRLNVGPSLALKLNNSIQLNLTGGMAVGRRLDFIDIDEETIDSTPENGPFFRIGFSLMPKGKKAGTTPNN